MSSVLDDPSPRDDTPPPDRRRLASIALASGTGEDIAALTEPGRGFRWKIGKQAARAVILVFSLAVILVWGFLALRTPIAGGLIAGESDERTGEASATAPAAMSPHNKETTQAPPRVTAYVSGSVASPGVYEAAAGSRVSVFVELAGGLASNADANAINLAAPVDDGAHILIPAVGEEVPEGEEPVTGSEVGTQGGRPINLNTASASELDMLPGIGPALAETIVSWREENGPFASVDDLLGVPGIGDAKLAKLRDRAKV